MKSGRASDKREMTHDDHTGKEISEAGGVQETIDTAQNSPGSETPEAVDFIDGTGEDRVQGFHSAPDGAEAALLTSSGYDTLFLFLAMLPTSTSTNSHSSRGR